MNSFNDLIPGISGISRISHSSSQYTEKIDSLHLTESQESVAQESSKDASLGLKNAIKNFSLCENSIAEFAQLKLIFECIMESSLNVNDSVSDDVLKKLRQLVLNHEAKKYLHLPGDSKDCNEELKLLGLFDLPKVKLTYEEKLNIKSIVESRLREKIHSFLLLYENTGGNLKELMKKNESKSNKILESQPFDLQYWKKIHEICIEYEKKLITCSHLLNEWIMLKQTDVTAMNAKLVQYLSQQAEVSLLQIKISKLVCTIKMFKETPVTIDAFRILNGKLDTQLSNAEAELNKNIALRKQYEDLEGTEFYTIVKEHQELCKAIQKKKYMLQILRDEK
ncbi:uncharacterized protein LOC107264239 [Cephus cinctus]|uniref:Uncharacterized protein LOC107264239 n=1 Tax=Cephus cinctus TaxID=211228 RepID=A0AAJ7FEG8_CEPCN|nr:uncharacterized protein LOC107264239 [Cephus cinctus]